MTSEEFVRWAEDKGYSLFNDYNWQEIKGIPHYWLKNTDTNLYALVKEYEDCFVVLVEDFNTFGCLD